jgi:hypothetical protein
MLKMPNAGRDARARMAPEEESPTGTRWKIPNLEIKPGAGPGPGNLNWLAGSKLISRPVSTVDYVVQLTDFHPDDRLVAPL